MHGHTAYFIGGPLDGCRKQVESRDQEVVVAMLDRACFEESCVDYGEARYRLFAQTRPDPCAEPVLVYEYRQHVSGPSPRVAELRRQVREACDDNDRLRRERNEALAKLNRARSAVEVIKEL